jgi:hypothetical protein
VQVHGSKLPLRSLSKAPFKGVSATALVGVTCKLPRSRTNACEFALKSDGTADLQPSFGLLLGLKPTSSA